MASSSLVMTIGAICFGVTVGFVTYRTLIRTTAAAAISDLGAVVAVIGGGVVTSLFDPQQGDLFGWYAIGLLGGLIGYGILYLVMNGRDEAAKVLGRPVAPARHAPADPNRL